MWFRVAEGILIPFLGTSLGAACVFVLRGEMSRSLNRALTGFASGIMVSASFFSLLLPALEQTADRGAWSILPAGLGFLIGMLFLLGLDMLIPHMHLDKKEEGPKSGLRRTTKLVLAVTLHNLPEGMAVGIVYAGWLYGSASITLTGALALALGIALQNFPEGAIVSMPLRGEGMPRRRTFLFPARAALAPQLRRRGHVLRGGGGADPGDVRGGALQHRHRVLRPGLCAHAGPGRGPGMKIQEKHDTPALHTGKG